MQIRTQQLQGAIGLTVAVLIFATACSAQEHRQASVLLDVPSTKQLSNYERPFSSLTESQQWHIRIHGLRLAPLHPAVWAGLKRERTQNRRLVPIKRFFLRASEDPYFTLTRMNAQFKFKPADKRYMDKMPHQKDPVFEIGFGGSFQETGIAEKPLRDRAYALRLSAFPVLASGLYLRESERFTRLVQGNPAHLEVGRDYQLDLRVNGNHIQADLNGAPYLKFDAPNAAHGLVSLQTSWHPIILSALTIEGSIKGKSVVLSGLAENK